MHDDFQALDGSNVASNERPCETCGAFLADGLCPTCDE